MLNIDFEQFRKPIPAGQLSSDPCILQEVATMQADVPIAADNCEVVAPRLIVFRGLNDRYGDTIPYDLYESPVFFSTLLRSLAAGAQT